MESKIKIKKVKFHHVSTYKKWQYKVCELIGVIPQSRFYVELLFTSDIELQVGDVVIFDNSLQARILKFGEYFQVFFFEETPVSYFKYSFNSLIVIGRPYAE